MKNRWIPLLAIFLAAVLCLSAWAQKPARLVVDNRTNATATVQVWRYTGYHWDWVTVANVPGGKWAPVGDVKNGDRFRATGVRNNPSKTVTLQMDKGYGGPQDIWILQ
jgi:hypothetical protein